MRKNKKAFTLIELIAVLVILAIIALIVTPLVMNIVKKAKDSANKRSVDAYGKALELSVANYLLEHKEYPTRLEGLKVEYTGSEVICGIKKLNEDGSIYLSKCSVAGIEVKDISTDDGWYHYGKTTLTAPIIYQAYNVGDIVTYNGMEFYVIEASDENTDYVTLLKAEPLTVDEVNAYGVDSNGINHVNRYTISSIGSAYNPNGYGGMAYYTSETCGRVNGSWVETGCTTDYDESEVKYVIDAWSNDKLNASELTEDSLGYKTRLITYNEITTNLGYEKKNEGTILPSTNGDTPSWVYNSNYSYWTMSPYNDSASYVWIVRSSGYVYNLNMCTYGYVVRPVISLLKSAI